MDMDINARNVWTDIPEYIMAEEIRHAMQMDGHLNALTEYVLMTGHQPKPKVKKYNCVGHL